MIPMYLSIEELQRHTVVMRFLKNIFKDYCEFDLYIAVLPVTLMECKSPVPRRNNGRHAVVLLFLQTISFIFFRSSVAKHIQDSEN